MTTAPITLLSWQVPGMWQNTILKRTTTFSIEEMKRKSVFPSVVDEAEFWAQGSHYVAGLDEAGRGPWAGPVYAAAVILPHAATRRSYLSAVRDSKTINHRRRVILDKIIRDSAIAVGVGRTTADEIDASGIVPATRLAMRRALGALSITPHALIIDALTLPDIDLPQSTFPYADSRSLAVAAAGIVAKVARDTWMVDTAEVRYPGYGFAQHKGYGTTMHRVNLDRLGVCALHRKSFRPIAVRLQKQM
jgi:ribonuclease HII